MNTDAENAQAMAEFRAGLFGPILEDPTPTDAATRRSARHKRTALTSPVCRRCPRSGLQTLT
jgi:hypothetical protein